MGDSLSKVKFTTRFAGIENSRALQTYEAHDGYKALRKAFGMQPSEIIEEVKKSGLRGRGGAGFMTGVKWGFVPKDDTGPKYLICNNDESEPGTFKDRLICEQAPHMIIEGMIIGAFAIGANKGYIYTRREFFEETAWLEKAIEEAYAAGYLGKNILGSGFDFDLDHYSGAGAYICGEETGLISSLEGKKGQPKLKPPFPAVSGYLERPTIVNNTETLALVTQIIGHGAETFRAVGTDKSAGTKLFCISGRVQRPGVYELPLGYPLEKLIFEDAGGMQPGYELKGVIPGGASAAILTAEEIKGLTLDFEALAEAKSMLGSGAVMVVDNKTSMVDLMKNIADFFAHESCGQCTPCREGTGWIANIMRGVADKTSTPADVERMHSVAKHMGGRTICALSDAAAGPTMAIVEKFGDELKAFLDA